ncbi:uncharacterized protein LOC143485868 [Brachyhypopomus gauderio]|uniref:uncharacterized protein LOC143485868 n=1 Tax=Brachyhypopomus gauderio TaxID=698409 RepID=UPI004042282A
MESENGSRYHRPRMSTVTPSFCKQNVRAALCSKPGGKGILEEYEKTSTISDISVNNVGSSMETFLKEIGPNQPFLLGVGERSNCIQDFYIILDQKAIPCRMQTPVAAFDELFKAHYAFAVSYDDALSIFFIFIQSTVYGIDVGKVKESPRVKEI